MRGVILFLSLVRQLQIVNFLLDLLYWAGRLLVWSMAQLRYNTWWMDGWMYDEHEESIWRLFLLGLYIFVRNNTHTCYNDIICDWQEQVSRLLPAYQPSSLVAVWTKCGIWYRTISYNYFSLFCIVLYIHVVVIVLFLGIWCHTAVQQHKTNL